MNQTVDFQIIVPRVHDLSRIQHIQQRNEQIQQQGFAVHLAHESERAQRTVQNPPHAREARIKDKEEKDKWTMQRRQQKKPSENKKGGQGITELAGNSESSPAGRYIDLKI